MHPRRQLLSQKSTGSALFSPECDTPAPLTDGSFERNSQDGNYIAHISAFFSPMTVADMTNPSQHFLSC